MADSTPSRASRPGGVNVRSLAWLTLVTLALASSAQAQSLAPGTAKKSLRPVTPKLVEGYGRLPLGFEVNRGQSHSKVKFLTRGPQHAVFLTDEAEAVFSLSVPRKDSQTPSKFQRRPSAKRQKRDAETIRIRLAGTQVPKRVEGLEPLPGKTNYFIGKDSKKWITNVPTYAKIAYREIYPGIDLVYYGNQGKLEYDFIVRPGGNPRNIELEFQGEQKISVNSEGDLVIEGVHGKIVQKKPYSYQVNAKIQRTVQCGFRVKGNHRVSFDVGQYDTRLPLTLDPTVLYTMFIGCHDFGTDCSSVAVDSEGCVYVAGYTDATDFPVTCGPSHMGSIDAFVSKRSADGLTHLFWTYLGGQDVDCASSIAVDLHGNAYVTGYTHSQDFPLMHPVQQTSSSTAAFVSKLSSTGQQLMYSTYFGTDAESHGIAVDPTGSAYIAGYTADTVPTVNSFKWTRTGSSDGFLARLTPDGRTLVFSSYLGGPGFDRAWALAIDGQGNAYVTGDTTSTNFVGAPAPTTFGSCTSLLGAAFITKVSSSGSLVYFSLLGGSEPNRFSIGTAIVVDLFGNVYVGGYTDSWDFPVKTPFQYYHAKMDGFVVKVNPEGSDLVYSTFLGGSGADYISSLAVSPSGILYLSGYTNSTDFPCIRPFCEADPTRQDDSFVTVLDSAGDQAILSTYLGWIGFDRANGIAVDSAGNAVVVGRSVSDSGQYAFITAISLDQPVQGPSLSVGGLSPSLARSGATVSVTVASNEALDPDPSLWISGKSASLVSKDSLTFVFQRMLQGDEGEPSPPIVVIGQNLSGDRTVLTTHGLTTDFTPPTFTDILASPSVAMQTTNVTLTFSVSEILASLPLVTVGSQKATLESSSGLSYTFRIPISAVIGEGAPTVMIQGTDSAGNTGLTTGQPLLTDFTAPRAQNLSVAPARATTGTTVTVSFTASEDVQGQPTVTMSGRPVGLSSQTGRAFVYSRKVDGSEGEGVASVRVAFKDLAGNTGITTSSIQLDFTGPVLTISSVQPSVARKGTTVVVDVTASEPLAQSPELTIGGRPAILVSHTTQSARFEHVLDGTEGEGTPEIRAEGVDLAGNRGVVACHGLTTDFTAPTFGVLSVVPALASTGTTVELSFETSEVLKENPTVTVGAQLARFVSLNGKVYRYDRQIDGREGEGRPLVQVQGIDSEGNTCVTTGQPLLTDFTAPRAQNLSVAPARATTGTTVTISFTASEDVQGQPTVTVAGLPAGLASRSGRAFVYSRKVDGSEGEGVTAVRVSIKDLAGNTGITTSSIQLDFTGPVLTIASVQPSLARKGTTVVVDVTASEPLGQAPELTIGGRPASLVSHTAQSARFERVLDGTEGEGTPEIRAEGVDLAGNHGLVTGHGLSTDFTAPMFGPLSVVPTLASTGTTVELSFEASEVLQANPAVTVGGQTARFVSLSGRSYRYDRQIDGREGEGRPLVQVQGIDSAGNTGLTTGQPLVTDFTAPRAPDLSVAPARATTGTTVTISFTASEDVQGQPTVTISGKTAGLASQSGRSFIFSRTVDGTEGEGGAAVRVSIKDLAGNTGITTSSIQLDFTGPVLTIASVQPSLARKGTTVVVDVTAAEPLGQASELTIGGRPASLVSHTAQSARFERVLDGTEGEGTPEIRAEGVDLAGNHGVVTGHGLATDFTAPMFGPLSAVPTVASTGTTVELSFETSEELKANPTVTVGAQVARFVSQKGKAYRYDRQIDGREGEGRPLVQVQGIDSAGNTGLTTGQPLVTDFTAPRAPDLSVTPARATTGSTVTISFTASEDVQGQPTVTVAGLPAGLVSRSGRAFVYSRKVDGSEGEGVTAVRVSIKDLAGNTGITTSSIQLDFTGPVLTIASVQPSLARKGTTVVVEVTSGEVLVQPPEMAIGGRPASLVYFGARSVRFERILDGSEGEGSPLIYVEGVDQVGNHGVATSFGLTTDFTTPSFSSISVSPSMARIGTTATVAFVCSEALSNSPEVLLNGKAAELKEVNGRSYTYSRVVDGTEGEGVVNTTIRGTDLAGNVGNAVSEELTTDFTAPRVQTVSVAPSAAKSGTTVTVQFSVSESLGTTPSVRIGGGAARQEAFSSGEYTFTRTLDGTEGEGLVAVTIDLQDRAGNRGGGSSATLTTDFTPPSIQNLSLAPKILKVGTTLNVSFSASETPWTTPSVSMESSPLTMVSSDSGLFVFRRVLDGTEREGALAILVRVVDKNGNASEDATLRVTADFTSPSFGPISVTPSVATSGTAVSIQVRASEPLAESPTVTIGGFSTSLTVATPPNFSFQRILDGTEGDGSLEVKVSGLDVAGNLGNDTSKRLVTDFSFPRLIFADRTPARGKVGTQVTASFKVSEPTTGMPEVTIGGQSATFEGLVDGAFSFRRTLDGTELEGNAPIRFVVSDLAGNRLISTPLSVLTDFTSPRPTQFSASPSLARVGTTVSVDLTTSESLGVVPTLLLGGQATTLVTSQSNVYRFQRTLDGTEKEGEVAGRLTLQDVVGNVTQTEKTLLIADFTKPTFRQISVLPAVCSEGRTVIVSFSVSETLATTPHVRIGTQEFTLRSQDGLKYSFSREMDGTETEGVIPIQITGQDLAGNEGPDTSAILRIDYTAPHPLNVTCTPAVATQGTTVEVSFTASEPLVDPPMVTVAGLPASLTTSEGLKYSFQINLTGEEDEGIDVPVLIEMTDVAGNAGQDDLVHLTTDFTDPQAIISAFPNPVWEGGTVQFSSLGSSAISGITTVFWSFGDGATSIQPQPDHAFFKSSPQVPVTLRVTSGVGKTAQAQLLLPVQNVSPTVSFDPLPTVVKGLTPVTWIVKDPGVGETFKVTLTATDLGLTRLPPVVLLPGLTSNGTFTWDTSLMAESSYQLSLIVTDPDGGRATASSSPQIVDNSPLSITVQETSPQYFNPKFGETTCLSYYLSEQCPSVRADVVQAVGGAVSRTLLVDSAQAPGINAVFWDGNDANNNVLAHGQYGLKVTASDLGGTQVIGDSLSQGFSITLLTTPPNAPTINSFFSPTRDNPLALTGGKDSSTLTRTGVAVSRGITPVASSVLDRSTSWSVPLPMVEGVNSFNVATVDQAGNRSPTVSVTVTLKTTAPHIAVTSPLESPTHLTTQTVTGTVDQGCYVYRVGNSTPILPPSSQTNWSQTVSCLAGANTFEFYAVDVAGNRSDVVTVPIELLPNFVTAPTINAVVTPTKVATQTLSGTKQASANVELTFQPSSSQTKLVIASTSTSWSQSVALAEGTNTITAQSYDSVRSASAEAVTTIQLDTVPPSVALSNIGDGALVFDANMSLGISYTDPAPATGIAQVTLLVDSKPVTGTVSPTSASVSDLGLSAGSHTFVGNVSDRVGNQSSATALFYVVGAADQTTHPVVTLVAVANVQFCPALNPSDTVTQRSVSVSYSVDQGVTGGVLSVVSSGGTTVASVPLSSAVPGRSYMAIWNGRDSFGNLVKDGFYRLTGSVTNVHGLSGSIPDVTARVIY